MSDTTLSTEQWITRISSYIPARQALDKGDPISFYQAANDFCQVFGCPIHFCYLADKLVERSQFYGPPRLSLRNRLPDVRLI